MRKTALAIVATAGVVTSLLAAGPAMASNSAAPARTGAHHVTITPVHHSAHMGSYAPAKFATQAAKLPASLAAQLRSKLGITPEQFLADGQAAADATKVISSLKAEGVDITGSTMNGTTRTVSVSSAAQEAAVRATGAAVTVAAAEPVPHATAQAAGNPADGSSPLQGGDEWSYQQYPAASGMYTTCSIGFPGYDVTTGAREFLTAGHCADYQHTGGPAPLNGTVFAEDDRTPGVANIEPDAAHTVGSLNQASFHFGDGDDAGLVNITGRTAQTQNTVTTWGASESTAQNDTLPSQGTQSSGYDVPVLGSTAAIDGAPICHSGYRTGWQCGRVTADDVVVNVEADATSQLVDSAATSACILPGDSGGAYVEGDYAVGVASASDATADSSGANCVGGSTSYLFPITSADGGQSTASSAEPSFQLGVAEPEATITLGTTDNAVSSFTGSLAFSGSLPAAPGTAVSLSIDGGAAQTTTSAATGSGPQEFDFTLSGLTSGQHTYALTVGSGYDATTQTGTFDGTVTAGTVSVSGTAACGQTLTASAAGASSHATLSYQWLNLGPDGTGNSPIAGATKATFAPSASLLGDKLAVSVTATELGAHTSAASAPTNAVAAGTLTVGAVSISGTAKVGSTLAASTGTWTPGTTLTYNWNGGGLIMTGSKTFTVASGDAGKTITLTVTGTLAGYTTASKSATVRVAAYTVPAASRLSGADRYATAVAVAKSSYPNGGAKVVVIASGANFPDALGAAPAAVKLGGPLLLTQPTSLPSNIAAEIKTLKPQKIVIVGGPSAVSAGVAAALGKLAPVIRVYGPDRYATSLAIAKYAFGSSNVPSAFVATGTAFPDALSASAYAGSENMPVVLVNGKTGALPSALTSWLKSAHTTSVSIAGGTSAVSAGIQTALNRATGHSAARFGGADRYATSQLINGEFTAAGTAYLATGANFPDALTGAAAAGKAHAPLFLVQPGCVPSAALASVTKWQTASIKALGGTSVLSSGATSMRACG